jgi:flagellar assembly factor FliW
MLIETRYFGTVDIEDKKILHFENGLFGFEQYQDFTILFNADTKEKPLFSWLQSVKEKTLAFPIVNPQDVKPDYDPMVEDGLLEPLGEISPDDLVILALATVPKDVKKASVNLKAPLIINAATRQGVQLIVENKDYEIKHYLLPEGGDANASTSSEG